MDLSICFSDKNVILFFQIFLLSLIGNIVIIAFAYLPQLSGLSPHWARESSIRLLLFGHFIGLGRCVVSS